MFRVLGRKWRFPTILAIAMLSPLLVGFAIVGGWAYFQFGTLRSASAFMRGDQLDLEPPMLDAGMLHAGDDRTLKVWAVNLTGETVRVNGGVSYCAEKACLAVVDEFPMSIPPRSKREIRIVIKANPPGRTRVGPFRYDTNIHTQLGSRSVAITGEVIAENLPATRDAQ